MANLIKDAALASVRCGNNPHSLYEFATASIRTSDTDSLARLRASFRSSFLGLGCSKLPKDNEIRKTEECFVESAPKERINTNTRSSSSALSERAFWEGHEDGNKFYLMHSNSITARERLGSKGTMKTLEDDVMLQVSDAVYMRW